MSDVFGKRLGQYILLEQLGEGGMAKVYNALDSRAERNVAIKVILPSKQSSRVFIQQFEQEAKSLANLVHTNIVKVLNYGVEDGQPYLVMEFIPGGTLKEAMQRPIPWQIAAAILAPIARALEYVHRQQIVHRDVKPSNILLDEEYHPMLSDFGIVKLLEAKEGDSTAAIGVGVGTPEYMSPEQGMGKDVDFRADIYSLGLVYYEMVTGCKPFAADTPMAAVIKHITDELPLPTAIDKKIPRFVEAAILRAVQKNPQDRYATMGEFAEALELIALGIEAPAKRILELTQKQKRKRSFQPKYLLTLLIPLILGLSYFGYNYWNRQASGPAASPTVPATVHAPTQAQPTKTASPTATEEPAAEPTASVIESSGSAQMDAESGIRLLDVPLEAPRSEFKPVALWGLGGVNRVEWSPDGSRIALGTTSGVFVYDSGSRQLQRFISTGYDVIDIAFHPNGDHILAASLDGQVNVWDLRTGKFVGSIGNTTAAKVNAITYSLNNKNMAIAYEDGLIQYYQVGQTAPLMSIFQPQSAKAVAISIDNRYLYVSNGENKIVVWDIAAREIDAELTSTVPINKMEMSKNGQYIITAGNGNAVSLWDLFEGRVVSSFSGLEGKVTDIEFSNDNKRVVIGLSNGTIKIFALPTPKEYSKAQSALITIQGLSETVHSLALSPDQGVIVAGNWKDGAKLWDAQTGEEAFTFEGHMRGVNRMYFSPDGAWLVTAHEDGVVRIWDVQNAHETYQFDGYLPKGLPFSLDNRFLVMIRPSPVRYQADLVNVIELSSGNVVAELPGYEDPYLVEFTDDTKLLIVGDDHTANFWDVSTWERLSTHGGMNAGCGQYFTPPNNLLAVIYDTGVLFSYDAKAQELCSKKPNGTTLVYYFEEPHDVFFVLGDGRVWSWNFARTDIANIHSSAPYPFPDQIFLAADQKSGWYAYARDARLLIQKNPDREPSWNLQYQDGYQYQVALLPGKHLMALGSRYGSIHIWTMP